MHASIITERTQLFGCKVGSLTKEGRQRGEGRKKDCVLSSGGPELSLCHKLLL